MVLLLLQHALNSSLFAPEPQFPQVTAWLIIEESWSPQVRVLTQPLCPCLSEPLTRNPHQRYRVSVILWISSWTCLMDRFPLCWMLLCPGKPPGPLVLALWPVLMGF